MCPIFEGGGTKIKVLESLAHGRTIVVARHSIRGYERELVDNESLLIADDEPQLAEACIRLFREDSLRHRLAATGAWVVSDAFIRPICRRGTKVSSSSCWPKLTALSLCVHFAYNYRVIR